MTVLFLQWTDLAGILWRFPARSPRRGTEKDKHGVGLQAKTVAQAITPHWLTMFDVPADICSDRGSHFVRSWFNSMCEHMGIPHAKTVPTTADQTTARRSPGGKCSRSSANCTSGSEGGTGFTLFRGFYKPFMTYRGLRGRLGTAFFSYGVQCPELFRG